MCVSPAKYNRIIEFTKFVSSLLHFNAKQHKDLLGPLYKVISFIKSPLDKLDKAPTLWNKFGNNCIEEKCIFKVSCLTGSWHVGLPSWHDFSRVKNTKILIKIMARWSRIVAHS
jgi:hypothetical protein